MGKKALVDKRKQSLYLPESLLLEIRREAEEHDITLSRVVQDCLRLVLDNLDNIKRVKGTIAFRDRIKKRGRR